MTGVTVIDLGLVKDQTNNDFLRFKSTVPKMLGIFLRENSVKGIEAVIQNWPGFGDGTVHIEVMLCDMQQHRSEVIFICQPEIPTDTLIGRFIQPGLGQKLRNLLWQRRLKVNRHSGGQQLPNAFKIRQKLCATMKIDDGKVAALRISKHLGDLFRICGQSPGRPAMAFYHTRMDFFYPAECPLHIPQTILCGNQT